MLVFLIAVILFLLLFGPRPLLALLAVGVAYAVVGAVIAAVGLLCGALL